ncbi:hypothetical protein BDY21DRAFT_345312 [Lineolata rhizophorae]|uniref:Ubiquitin-like 1-activating enzyme E1A n=1 Tax=Lineolata rhizophorae TaxID=578093 RepID=A0A6A6P0F6_9PEZI|nr:hypothetical protein BDY21DRAFT_345312 [Lineolata rhizophorae]
MNSSDAPAASSPAEANHRATVAHDMTSNTAQEQQLPGQHITADEIALYDRQIRLWGVKAQEQIRTANILLVSIKALASEVAKNLVLAGIGSLTIVDPEHVTEDDLGAQFFVTEDDVGKNRAEAAAPRIRKLNPRVAVHTHNIPLTTQPPSFFSSYQLVIACDLPFATLCAIDAAARLAGTPFYAGGAHGMYGFVFADLGAAHDFVIERDRPNVATRVGTREGPTRTIVHVASKKDGDKVKEVVTKRETYCALLLANAAPLPEAWRRNRRKLRTVTPLLTCLRALWEFEKVTTGPAGVENGLGMGAINPSAPTPTTATTTTSTAAAADPANPTTQQPAFHLSGRHPSPLSPPDLQLFTRLATTKHSELLLPAETLRSAFLRSFLQNLDAELAPVTAFLGGQLAQEAINVLGHREQPIQNLLCFDGEESVGMVVQLSPFVGEDGAGGAVAGSIDVGMDGMGAGGTGKDVGMGFGIGPGMGAGAGPVGMGTGIPGLAMDMAGGGPAAPMAGGMDVGMQNVGADMGGVDMHNMPVSGVGGMGMDMNMGAGMGVGTGIPGMAAGDPDMQTAVQNMDPTGVEGMNAGFGAGPMGAGAGAGVDALGLAPGMENAASAVGEVASATGMEGQSVETGAEVLPNPGT